jgi:protein-tyrosine phosphatase
MITQNSKPKTQNSLTDWHCHLLPHLDDGSDSLEESLEMGRSLERAGVTTVYCTPHCMRGVYENTPEGVRAKVAELQGALGRAGISLRLQPGMEYYLDEFFPRRLDDLLPLGDTGMVLVEAPTGGYHDQIRDFIFQVRRKGFTPLFAHPERYDFLAEKQSGGIKELFRKAKRYLSSADEGENSKLKTQNSKLLALRDLGCLFQGNLGSFRGFYGSEVRKTALAMQAAGIYHCYGTDAHRASQIV